MTSTLQDTSLPWRQVNILLLMRLADPISFTVLFPFVYFMVKDFHLTEDDAKVGFYVGFIASSFAFSQMLTVLPWGMLSDKIGRRPVVLSGLLGTAVGLFMFGLSQTLVWAIVTRSMAGLLSGNIGVVKTIMGEITNESNRAQAFSLMPMMYGIGCIIGPTLGGFLSNPMDKFPWLFGDSLVGRFLTDYPYFLPCGICSMIIFIGFILGVVYLEETLEREPIIDEETPLFKDTNSHKSYRGISQLKSQDGYYPNEPTSSQPDQELTSDLRDDGDSDTPGFFTSIPKSSWITILSYTLQGLLSVTYTELLPLWAATPIAMGGLGFNTSDIGSIIAFSGIALLFIQILIYPKLHRKFGTLLIFRRSYLFYVLVALLFPIAAHIQSTYLFWSYLLSLIIAQSACSNFTITSVNILIVEMCPDKKILGRINGLALAFSSLIRAIGPSLCGIIYSWSLSNQYPNPLLHAPLAWITLAIFSLMSYLFSLKLDSPTTTTTQ